MQEDQRVAGEDTPEAAFKAVLRPGEARRLEEQAEQERLEQEQQLEKERRRAQQEERNRIQRKTDWEQFMQRERRELRLRKDGQLSRLLGEPLAGEPAAALRWLAEEDRRQAEQGLVALMSGGELRYKPLDELSPEDMPARVAAERLRTTWLKERRDVWLAHGDDAL